MKMIGRGISLLATSLSLIGTICIVLMMLHVTADVAGRYLFNSPLPGTIVIVANYYMVLLVFLALAVTEEKRGHISVEFFADMMPERAQIGLSGLSGALTVAVMVVLAIGGWTEAMKKTASGTTMEQGSRMIEVWQSYWAVPVGAGLMALVAAWRMLAAVAGADNGLSEPDSMDIAAND